MKKKKSPATARERKYTSKQDYEVNYSKSKRKSPVKKYKTKSKSK
jgi:hypothetical protein